MRILFVLRRIGPYHHARFSYLINKGIDLIVIETRPNSEEYLWNQYSNHKYKVIKFKSTIDKEVDLPNNYLDKLFSSCFDKHNPQVIVSVGWSDRSYQRLMISSYKHRIPIVIVSDSRFIDSKRNYYKEAIKRHLLRGYSAALVAGKESRDYLLRLNFDCNAIFQPWDVVDNDYFMNDDFVNTYNLNPYFLCVSRFIPKKNLFGLIEAYSNYQKGGGNWSLNIIGSGQLDIEIRKRSNLIYDNSKINIYPFQQLSELRRSYSNANAFILPSINDQWGLVVNEAIASGLPCIVSSRCGSNADLIVDEVTGFIFDPENLNKLSELMHRLEKQKPTDRIRMIDAARNKLKSFNLFAFSNGLESACNYAISSPCFSRKATIIACLLSRC